VSSLSSENDRCTRSDQDDASQICPKRPPQKPGRTQSRCESGVNKMLNPEGDEGDGKEISPQFEERIGRFALLQGSSASENPCASAHCQGHKSAGPLVSIVRIANDPRNVQENHEKKEHHSQHRCRRSRQHSCEDTDGSRNERHANKVRPEQPPRHKRRHQSCHETAINEMLHPENDQGNGNEYSSWCLALFHREETCCRPHSAVATFRSLHELASGWVPNRAPHPALYLRRNAATVFRNSGDRCPRTGPCPAFGQSCVEGGTVEHLACGFHRNTFVFGRR